MQASEYRPAHIQSLTLSFSCFIQKGHHISLIIRSIMKQREHNMRSWLILTSGLVLVSSAVLAAEVISVCWAAT